MADDYQRTEHQQLLEWSEGADEALTQTQIVNSTRSAGKLEMPIRESLPSKNEAFVES